MLLTDPHVLAKTLFDDGKAFNDMLDEQRKMLDLSEDAFTALIDTALLYRPDLVLIAGDLTKDSEAASHAVVVDQLNRLKVQNIPVLLIPGNHDIGGKAYSYIGDEKQEVPNLTDAEWESTYAQLVYDNAAAKDPNSHSFVAEPLPFVTILGIDGAHNAAGTGSLSDETLRWLLTQADEARAKGNMVLGMCHWQLVEHVDKQSSAISSSRLADADAIRDSLLAHEVRVLLTGHFHVNGITTYTDTLSLSSDSLVEITTGSPITYPCPFRWLTVTHDRQTIGIETGFIRSLDTIADMETYSREWMRVHAANMVPQMTLRAFNRIEPLLDEYSESATMGVFINFFRDCIPESDSAKVALVEKHLGSTIVELYLLHSAANEPEHPEADSLAQAFYAGMESMIHEMTDEKVSAYTQWMQDMIISMGKSMAKEPVQSLVEDKTNWKSAYYADVTDDLHLLLDINEPIQREAIENILSPSDADTYYDLLGRPVSHPDRHGIYIRNGQKLLR